MTSDSCGSSSNPLEFAGYTAGTSTSVKPLFASGVTALSVQYTDVSGTSVTRDLGTDDTDEILTAQCTSVAYFDITATTNTGTCTIRVGSPCANICPSRKRALETDESFKEDTDADDEEDVEDVPYCLSEDFPCEGEDENMVYVCHYIPRKGYQTFCVHEADSVILGFYPNDYCGPCEGGYGNVGK